MYGDDYYCHVIIMNKWTTPKVFGPNEHGDMMGYNPRD